MLDLRLNQSPCLSLLNLAKWMAPYIAFLTRQKWHFKGTVCKFLQSSGQIWDCVNSLTRVSHVCQWTTMAQQTNLLLKSCPAFSLLVQIQNSLSGGQRVIWQSKVAVKWEQIILMYCCMNHVQLNESCPVELCESINFHTVKQAFSNTEIINQATFYTLNFYTSGWCDGLLSY